MVGLRKGQLQFGGDFENNNGCLPQGQIQEFLFSHSEKFYSIILVLPDIYVRFINAL